MAERVILALGSNVGDREAHLQRAVTLLRRSGDVQLISTSSIYVTPPWGVAGGQEDYLNQVVVIATELPAPALLKFCQQIEMDLGRPRDHAPGTSRCIDIDVISYGSLVSRRRDLTIPHPRYTQRKFVLVPLSEIYPSFRDPLTGRTIPQLLTDCADPSTPQLWNGLREVPC